MGYFLTLNQCSLEDWLWSSMQPHSGQQSLCSALFVFDCTPTRPIYCAESSFPQQVSCRKHDIVLTSFEPQYPLHIQKSGPI
jgi:hypothetical protein